MSFDWDSVLITKDPDSKEVIISFPGDGLGYYGSLNAGSGSMDPGNAGGDVPVEVEEPIVPADPLPECSPHNCDALTDFLLANPDASTALAKTYGSTGGEVITNIGNSLLTFDGQPSTTASIAPDWDAGTWVKGARSVAYRSYEGIKGPCVGPVYGSEFNSANVGPRFLTSEDYIAGVGGTDYVYPGSSLAGLSYSGSQSVNVSFEGSAYILPYNWATGADANASGVSLYLFSINGWIPIKSGGLPNDSGTMINTSYSYFTGGGATANFRIYTDRIAYSETISGGGSQEVTVYLPSEISGSTEGWYSVEVRGAVRSEFKRKGDPGWVYPQDYGLFYYVDTEARIYKNGICLTPWFKNGYQGGNIAGVTGYGSGMASGYVHNTSWAADKLNDYTRFVSNAAIPRMEQPYGKVGFETAYCLAADIGPGSISRVRAGVSNVFSKSLKSYTSPSYCEILQ